MIDINTKDEEDENELPLPSKKKGKKINPPESKDNLLSKDPRLNKLKRKKSTLKKDDLIYNKNIYGEEDDKENPPEKKNSIRIYETKWKCNIPNIT